jgi:hypothetical protein
MKALILAQLSSFATRILMTFVADLTKMLIERQDSSINKDGKKILSLLNKNIKEDREAGFDKARTYLTSVPKKGNQPIR